MNEEELLRALEEVTFAMSAQKMPPSADSHRKFSSRRSSLAQSVLEDAESDDDVDDETSELISMLLQAQAESYRSKHTDFNSSDNICVQNKKEPQFQKETRCF